jgi:predicted kinase
MRSRPTRVLLVTGLPATGKTTLARMLARRWSAPLLAKDVVKEPLLDVLGAADAAASRRLSDASFAIVFALARELVAAGVSVVLEGNFRPAEHAAPLLELPRPLECAQVLCRTEEPERIRRLGTRVSDSARHAGHRDAEQARAPSSPAEYLNLAGERFLFAGTEAPDWPELLERLDRWWQAA